MVRIEESYSFGNLYLKSRKKFKTSDIESLIDFEGINKNRGIKIKGKNLTIFGRYQREEYRIICLLNGQHYCVMSISLTKEFEKDIDGNYIIPIEFLDDFIDSDLLYIISIHSIGIVSFMKTGTLSLIRNLGVSGYEGEKILKEYIKIVGSYKTKTISNKKFNSFDKEKIIKETLEGLKSDKIMKKVQKNLGYIGKDNLEDFLDNVKTIGVKFTFVR